MKKFILTLASLLAFNSQAAVISVDLADTEINVGESTTVSVIGDFASQIELFDTVFMSVFLDNSQLMVDESSYATDLPVDSEQFVDFYNNTDFSEVTFTWLDFYGPFDSPVSFTLLSFDVTATTAGEFAISLFDSADPDYLFFANYFDEVTDITTSGATLNVVAASAEVAAPQTTLLLSMVLGGMLLARRRA